MPAARQLALPLAALLALAGPALLGGCTGPCDEACESVVRGCGQRADSYSAAPSGHAPRGCDQVDPGPDLDQAICLEQCQDWHAEGAECLAGLSCGDDDDENARAIAACLEERGRADNERDPDDADISDCRRDCDRQAEACGSACTTQHGDTPTCAGCFDNCDKGRARCRGWCKLIGQ